MIKLDDVIKNEFVCSECGGQLDSDGNCLVCLAQDPNDDDADFYHGDPTSHPDYEPQEEE